MLGAHITFDPTPAMVVSFNAVPFNLAVPAAAARRGRGST